MYVQRCVYILMSCLLQILAMTFFLQRQGHWLSQSQITCYKLVWWLLSLFPLLSSPPLSPSLYLSANGFKQLTRPWDETWLMIASINALSDRLPIRNTKHHLSLSPFPPPQSWPRNFFTSFECGSLVKGLKSCTMDRTQKCHISSQSSHNI